MANDLEDRLDELEKRVARLEYRDRQVFRVLVHKKDPVALFVLDHDLNAEQVKGIEEVMEEAHKTLEGGGTIEAGDFERRLLPYIPERDKPGGIGYHFTQGLLITFTRTGQWHDVCDHFRCDLNVPPLERLGTD